MATIADLVVPQLADWCFIYILDDAGNPRLLAVSHPDPERVKRAWELDRRFPLAMDKGGGTTDAVHGKCPVLVSDNVSELLVKRARNPEHLQAMLGLGICSLLIVPLVARNRVLGTITLASAESGIHYDENDQAFAMELATRAAIAIDNARLYREAQDAIREKDEALTLLRSVLQQMPAGVVIAKAPNGEIVLRNEIAKNFLRRDPDSHAAAIHSTEAVLQAFYSDGRPYRKEDLPLIRAIRTGETTVGEELTISKPDGGCSLIRINSGAIRDHEGRVVAAVAAFEDVTEARAADRALRESEEKFRTVAEVAPCSIFIHDGEHLLYVNPATCAITGYSCQELLSKSLWDLLHPESIPSVRDRFRRRREELPVPRNFEERIICKDGTSKWIQFNGQPIHYEERSAVMCVALDVTERRHMDERLRLTQERVRLAAESAGITSWEWDIRTNRVIWSPEVRRVFGFPYEAQPGITFDQFLSRIHDEDRQRVRECIEWAVSDHSDMSVEFRIQHGNGEYGWAHTRAKIFHDETGQPERMIGIGIDITANRMAEIALRQSEERFRMMFNQAAVGMAHVAPDGSFLMVNNKLAEILGYPKDELIGRKFHEFAHPDDLSANAEKLDAMLSGEIPSYTLEERYIRPDGTCPWVQITSSLVRDEETNQPKYLITVVEDVTERRRATEALRNSERLAVTGRLAATIAHEINNPLEAVTNLLYLLEQNRSLDKTARGYAVLAQEEVNRVAHIARQTLGFYRDSSKLETVQVSRLMDEVVSLFAAKIRTSEVEVTKELEADAPIEALPGELRQVFSNLLANALEAAGKKGKLRIRIRPARSARTRSQRGVRLTIADNGPGIARKDLGRIFEPFFTTKGAKGTGLGLWVTHGLVEKHNGQIRVWSSCRPGQSGTVFTVFLPLRQKIDHRRHPQSQVS